jgi:mannan endo-1,4-beta-mannosidase
MIRLLPAILLILLAVTACGPSTEPSSFVSVEGERLLLDGRPYRFIGVNYWYGMNLASPGPGGDRERLARELDLLASLGVTNLRVMAGSEGPDNEPYRVTPALQTAPGVYDPDLLLGLDHLLAEAGRRDLRLVLCLNNFWPWTGGMAQYVAWATGEEIPYPAGPEADWDRYQDFAARFYDNPAACSTFRDHATAMVTRVNSVTGIAYRDDPTIMAWELANEPRGMGRAAAFNRWIDETAALIKSLDPNHLVTTGCEGDTPLPGPNGLDFTANHDGPHIDYGTVHIWPQNWGWFDPARPDTYAAAEAEALRYLGHHARQASALGKPLVLEEFGLARDGGSLDPTATTTQRDAFFAAVLAAMPAGANIWAWAGEGRPDQGWTGDPPHEPQGWYSVYDTDRTTLVLLRETAAGH